MKVKLFVSVIIAAIASAFVYQLLLINSPQAALFEPKLISLALTSEFILFIAVVILLMKLSTYRHNNDNLQEKVAEIKVQYEDQMKYSEAFFNHLSCGLALVELDGHIERANHAFCQSLGYLASDIVSINYFSFMQSGEVCELQTNLQKLINGEITSYQSQQQCQKRNGEMVWTETTLLLIPDVDNKPRYFLVQLQNIAAQKKSEERLQDLAYHDPLTNLANRNKLEQFASHLLASSRRQKTGFAIMFLDLDRFKNVNDSIGHEAGDMLLQIVAERLCNAVRNTDMVARLGGDEFIILVTDVKRSEAVAIIAQKILENVLEEIVIQEQEIYITTSIGISLYPYDGQDMQTLMRHADLALYRAKEQGRNNYQFYTNEMTNRALDKLALQNALGHALAKDELLLNYQPKLELATRQITGVEALLRWKNKEFNTVTPDEIIMVAEESGLIVPVSDWIVNTACQQLMRWHQSGLTSLSIAVNCSSRQFKHASFTDSILSALTNARLSPHALEIEITEKIIMDDPENALRILYSLKDIGVQIVVDDFGTGYWSLSNLRRLSIDKIKIDKTFIKQVAFDATSATITTAILAMANKLGIKTIAEGVETREQYDFLLKEGCSEIQGYYLTQPLPEELMTQFLKHPVPDAEAITKNEIIT